tara:strand:- start:7750 stop:7875 length:126 start_codon:yes stop_codon:yes gene_type:complete
MHEPGKTMQHQRLSGFSLEHDFSVVPGTDIFAKSSLETGLE